MSRYYGEICDCRDAAENSENRVKRPQARFDGLEVSNHRKTKEARSRGFSAILEGAKGNG